MYRTGDRVRLRRDGTLEYLDRRTDVPWDPDIRGERAVEPLSLELKQPGELERTQRLAAFLKKHALDDTAHARGARRAGIGIRAGAPGFR